MYEAFPEFPTVYDHIPLYTGRRDSAFYLEEANAVDGPVLELGCGTGRVLLPIARAGKTIDGLDSSSSMLGRLKEKLATEPSHVRGRVHVHLGDVRTFDLAQKFSLVTAPFRVVQHLISIDEQLSFLAAVRKHLRPGGRLTFDVFNPNFSLLSSTDGVEREDTPETRLPDGRTFRRTGRVKKIRKVDQVSEIELIYYLSRKPGEPPERHVQSFDMRWYLREELQHLLARGGFRLRNLYGDFDRSPLADESPEQIVCAELL